MTTFVDHFLNFAIYGPLFWLCLVVIGHLQDAVTARRASRRAHTADAARDRARKEAYPKKTSASA